jgi:hypothetical protein
MITQHDEHLLARLRQGMSHSVPLQAAREHFDTPHDDYMPKVHLDHGPPGTPEHENGMVNDPANHRDKPHTDVERDTAIADENPSLSARSASLATGVNPALQARFDALLGRMEDIMLAREQQLHRDVSVRLDTFVAEMTSAFARLQTETATMQQHLAALERRLGSETP